MCDQGKNVRVSFKLSREAAIKLREIALTKGELLCSLGVLAVQLGNESQICISSPLNFNCPILEAAPGRRKEKHSEEGFDSELTDSAGDSSENEKMDEESGFCVDGGVREVDQAVALATAASVKLTNDCKSSEGEIDKPPLMEASTCNDMSARGALFKQIHAKKSKEETKLANERNDGVSDVKASQDVTSDGDSTSDSVNNQNSTFDGSAITGVSFAQQLINLSKQYRQENAKSPTNMSSDKYFASDTSQIVGRDHILRCFNDKPEDFMGLSVNNSLLFDSYGASSVKSAEELSKEQSEMSPTLATNLDSMSVSSPDSLFEEARLGSVDELRLSPSSVPISSHEGSQGNTSSESLKSENSTPPKLKKSAKFQRLLKGHTGIVCELCMHAVQKSYSCYQMAHAPKEIMHLFNDGSRCVRVCRRCLPYKAPKSHEKNGHKKSRKTSELSK